MPINFNMTNGANQAQSLYGGNPTGVDFTAGNKNPLVSDASTGKISGGTLNQRREAKGKKPINANALIGAGLGVGSKILGALDKDDKYGGLDVAKKATQMAAAGAALGPIGAGFGFLAGGIMGLQEKKDYEENQERIRKQELKDASFDSIGQSMSSEANYFNRPTGSGMYGVEQIDNFIIQNK